MNIMRQLEPLIRLEDVNLIRPILSTTKHHSLSKQGGLVGGKIDHDRNKTSIHALRDVNLTIPSGARVGVIGHNGGGKTTLLRVIAGIYQPTSGKCVVQGRVGALLSGAMGLDPDTTGRESIRFVGELYGVKDAHTDAFIEEVSEFSGLGEFLEFPIRTYSAGMRTRLGLSIVTGIRPDILILDEVLSTGDRAFRKHARERLVKLATSVKILVLAAHSIGDIQEFCDRAIYLEQGRIECSGSCEEAWACYLERSSAASASAVAAPVGKKRNGSTAATMCSEEESELAQSGERAAAELSDEEGAAAKTRSTTGNRPGRVERLGEIARRVGVPEETIRSLAAITELHELETLSLLLTHAPGVGIEQVARARLETRFGPNGAPVRRLAIALFQVPAAEERRAAQGMDPAHTEATMADLGVWARRFLKRDRTHGITMEILKWSQRYLTGDLARIGSVQYEIAPFSGEVRAYREPSSRNLSVVALDGRAIDRDGNLTDQTPTHEGWELAVEPGSPMLELHFPENARITLTGVVKSLKDAFDFYARWKPEAKPLGVFGTSWELDPQISALLPRNLGLHAIQQGGRLYPCKSSEKNVIRRLFGLEVTRADLPSLPRDRLNSLQCAIVDLLKDPDAALGGRGAFFLREDFEARYLEVFGKPGDDVVLQEVH
jgi:ABC-type polysaccharide/polyol phosphate transport system ATPase subunit